MNNQLSDKEIISILSSALQNIKNAPLSRQEMTDIAQDACDLLRWGIFDVSTQTTWSKAMVEMILDRRSEIRKAYRLTQKHLPLGMIIFLNDDEFTEFSDRLTDSTSITRMPHLDEPEDK